jgi:hypothetical protein
MNWLGGRCLRASIAILSLALRARSRRLRTIGRLVGGAFLWLAMALFDREWIEEMDRLDRIEILMGRVPPR